MKKLTVDFSVRRNPKVAFDVDDGWVTKQEVNLAIKAIWREHKRLIRDYNAKKIIAAHEARKLEQKESMIDGKGNTSTNESASNVGTSPSEHEESASAETGSAGTSDDNAGSAWANAASKSATSVDRSATEGDSDAAS
jgi:hypothetical protein